MSRLSALVRLVVPAAVAGCVTTTLRRTLDAHASKGFRRTNFRGREVTLSAGPAVVGGLLAGCAASDRSRVAAAGALVVAAAGLAGGYDDAASVREREQAAKGIRGHLAGLRAGQPSAGVVKVVAIGGASAGAALIVDRRSTQVLVDAPLIAGAANLVNLLDLRPGRALKAGVVAAGLLSAGAADPYRSVAAAASGAALAALPADLGERSMLGDTGANALGAALGIALCGRRLPTRIACLAGILSLTLFSERVSFSAVIDGNPVLRRIDALGRAGD